MSPSFISHELYLIYDPESDIGRKTHALALSLDRVLHEINIMDKSITRLHWNEIISMLHLPASQLLSDGHPDYSRFIKNNDYSEQDFLEIVFQNPRLVKGPIGILQNKAVLCDNPTDILHLDFTPVLKKNPIRSKSTQFVFFFDQHGYLALFLLSTQKLS